jgi:heme/copper-type cytochrome/quinol oxidase subunit 2
VRLGRAWNKGVKMNSNAMRVGLGIAAVAVAVVLFVVLKGDESGKSTNEQIEEGAKTEKGARAKVPPVATIVIKHGKPVGGIAQLTYNEGERVRFRVDSDVSDEIHVHGYDIMKDVEAGGSVSFDFPATLEGVFEAELEDRGEQILELTVNP